MSINSIFRFLSFLIYTDIGFTLHNPGNCAPFFVSDFFISLKRFFLKSCKAGRAGSCDRIWRWGRSIIKVIWGAMDKIKIY